MRDIPFFTTENGVASLTLCDIPYTQCAYIRIQQSENPQELLREAASFCAMAGAQNIYCTGADCCASYPLHTIIYNMQTDVANLGDSDACLFPVTSETLPKWCEIYNEKILRVPNGAWMSQSRAEQLLKDADAYFIHRNGQLLGIGKASGSTIYWVASVQKGSGAEIVKALCHALANETVCLEVASANVKAMQLYESLGFVPIAEVSRWYCFH